ncbi:hypothetical protein G9A89_016104 [Geosiphon pyriformis]|nr:hypothetical protein G9A89_016104 [Geosiphon pyriformis]
MTHFTPFKLVYRRKAILPIKQEILFYSTETITKENFKATLYHRMYQLIETLENNRKTAANNISNTQEQQKERHDKHLLEQPMEFKIGDQVLLYYGLFHIHEALGNGAYKLRLEDKILKKVVHRNQLKIYHAKQKSSSSIPQLGTQISLIRPEDIPRDLKPIIIIEIVQLKLNVFSFTYHPKGNVGEKIAFRQKIEKKKTKNEKNTLDNAQEWKKKLSPAYWFYKIREQLDLKTPYEDLNQKMFNKEAIQQVKKFIGKNNLTLYYKAAY